MKQKLTMEHVKVLEPRPHHVQQEVCTSRPKYRQGRKLTAVKAWSPDEASPNYRRFTNAKLEYCLRDLRLKTSTQKPLKGKFKRLNATISTGKALALFGLPVPHD
ncbi:unnamed protein product [Darwinula stevensoni]|uniref:Uncharacterized protein n=1 Tax=Darwinula stevensoni TaxID=69355 RepID=A0A7R8XDK2_9CRUS|nr:unnamed protein product [Darwinula stevensoni]CAG0888771.1 unnamed protein product [Darwinula stevensoni]